MSKTYSAGIVTAYGAAKRAGYTGTYEDFCRQQAQYAENAQAVEQAKQDAQTVRNQAQTAKDDAVTAKDDAVSAKNDAVSAKNTAVAKAQEASQSATSAGQSATSASQSATNASQSATSAGQSATDAEQSAQSVSASVQQIATNTADISQIKADFTHIKRNNIAYVSNDGISWNYSGASCSLTITGSVIIRDYVHYSTAIEVTKDTILTKASQNASVTVSGNTITGYAFAIYYDYASGDVIISTISASKNVYANMLLLFGWHWGTYIGGALLESGGLFETKKIYPIIDLRQRIAVAYASNNGITWDYTGTTCNLTITDSIVIRDYASSNGSRIISKSDVLTTVSQASISGVTVSGDTVSGSNFAIYYDFTAGAIKADNMNPRTLYNDTILLFGHYWGSYTGGALVESRNAKTYDQVQSIQAGLDTLSPFVIPSFLTSEISSVVSSIKDTCTEKAMVIAFTTDNHFGASNGSNWPDTINSIKAINSKYALDAVVDGGDMINGDEVVSTSKNRLSTMLSNIDIPNVRAYGIVGNHDDNSFTADREVQITQDDLYALIGRPTIKNYDVFDNSKVYGYKDYPVYGIRLVVMDARIDDTKIGDNVANWGYDTDQVNWFINTALDTDLQVVVFSHMGLTPEYSGSTQGTYPVNGTTIRTAIESFISNGGVFVGWFHGHTHWDFIGQYSNANGFHEVSTGCGRIVSGPIPSAWNAPEGATMPNRTAGTVTQELYDIIVIKPDSKKVDMIRFGAGDNRNFTY